MNLSHLLTSLLVGAMACFVSGAEASPHFQPPKFSLLPLQAGLKCGLVNGHIECGDSGGKHHDDADDNDDDHHQKKNKHNDDDTGLENCTIQSSNSGGGCKTGFKRVCEKLKSGKKCCGCVVDPNAKPVEQPAAEKTQWICKSDVISLQLGAANETEARSVYDDGVKARGLTPKGPVTCAKLQ